MPVKPKAGAHHSVSRSSAVRATHTTVHHSSSGLGHSAPARPATHASGASSRPAAPRPSAPKPAETRPRTGLFRSEAPQPRHEEPKPHTGLFHHSEPKPAEVRRPEPPQPRHDEPRPHTGLFHHSEPQPRPAAPAPRPEPPRRGLSIFKRFGAPKRPPVPPRPVFAHILPPPPPRPRRMPRLFGIPMFRYRGAEHYYYYIEQPYYDASVNITYQSGYYDEDGTYYRSLNSERLMCEYCGAGVEYGARYCPECGAALRVAEDAATVQPAVTVTAAAAAAELLPPLTLPTFSNPLQRGQRAQIGNGVRQLDLRFGWNVSNAQCDADISVFPLNADGKVSSDEQFVFYSQPVSADGGIRFYPDARPSDREHITVDLDRIDPAVCRVVFVLTINEALEHGLDFSMISGCYMRVLNGDTGEELAGYIPEADYSNITSMTIAELYLKNGVWRVSAVGNGLHTDLSGQCAEYGVRITD